MDLISAVSEARWRAGRKYGEVVDSEVFVETLESLGCFGPTKAAIAVAECIGERSKDESIAQQLEDEGWSADE